LLRIQLPNQHLDTRSFDFSKNWTFRRTFHTLSAKTWEDHRAAEEPALRRALGAFDGQDGWTSVHSRRRQRTGKVFSGTHAVGFKALIASTDQDPRLQNHSIGNVDRRVLIPATAFMNDVEFGPDSCGI
jgi:hypothetical protein